MAAQPTWYFIQIESARYSPTMTELLEANERSQTEQGRPDSKTQAEKMQVGVDSFAAQFVDNSAAAGVSASNSIRQLVERIELADQVSLDVFGVGEHHRREFLDSAPALILAAAAARDWAQALAHLKEALEICGACRSRGDLHKNLGIILCMSGDLKNGASELQEAHKIKPDDPDIEQALRFVSEARQRR